MTHIRTRGFTWLLKHINMKTKSTQQCSPPLSTQLDANSAYAWAETDDLHRNRWELEISSPNLTYHLESLGELVYKMDNDRYKLSAFGHATINAMKSIEEVREVEPKRRTVTSRWRMFSIGLMVAVILLASFAALQSNSINQLASVQQSLTTEIQRFKPTAQVLTKHSASLKMSLSLTLRHTRFLW